MPQPESITEEWKTQVRDDFRTNPPTDLPAFMVNSEAFLNTCVYPANWAAQELVRLECPDDVREEILFTLGQKFFAAHDPWAVAMRVVADWEQGRANTNVPTMVITTGGKEGRSLSFLPLSEEEENY